MSFGIGPHDYGCVCWRCHHGRGVSLLNESQGPEVIKGHCKTAHKNNGAHPEGRVVEIGLPWLNPSPAQSYAHMRTAYAPRWH